MKSFTFRLPVKKYIQKYLTSLYGETIAATMETDIGFVVLNTIASRIDAQVARGYNKVFNNTYQAQVTFIIPFHYFYLTKKEISVSTCILLNRYFENKFQEDLMKFMALANLNQWGNYRKALEQFAEIHKIDIEEDITYDGLRKIEYRCSKKNSEKSLCGLSPIYNLFNQSIA